MIVIVALQGRFCGLAKPSSISCNARRLSSQRLEGDNDDGDDNGDDGNEDDDDFDCDNCIFLFLWKIFILKDSNIVLLWLKQ